MKKELLISLLICVTPAAVIGQSVPEQNRDLARLIQSETSQLAEKVKKLQEIIEDQRIAIKELIAKNELLEKELKETRPAAAKLKQVTEEVLPKLKNEVARFKASMGRELAQARIEIERLQQANAELQTRLVLKESGKEDPGPASLAENAENDSSEAKPSSDEAPMEPAQVASMPAPESAPANVAGVAGDDSGKAVEPPVVEPEHVEVAQPDSVVAGHAGATGPAVADLEMKGHSESEEAIAGDAPEVSDITDLPIPDDQTDLALDQR